MPITSTASRSEAEQISSAWSMATGVSSIAQIRVRSGAPWRSRAASMARTSATELTLGTTTPSGPAAAMAARSSSCHGVPMPLARMVISRLP